MNSHELQRAYLDLTTPHVADTVMRLGIPVRQAPASIRPLWEDVHVVGRVRPAQHTGSVDVSLEAVQHASPGDVLVVDNGGRADEACVGDLVTLEVQQGGLPGSSSGGCTATPANSAPSACPSSAKAPSPQDPSTPPPNPGMR